MSNTIPKDTRILVTNSKTIPGYHVVLASGIGDVVVFSEFEDARRYVEGHLNGILVGGSAGNGARVWFYA